mmetsp:Transcript_8566/g.20947  ORF Transcript_8566/g.20947 Transcript_8566/m.20947 type:complete len:81 (-) Transcript_8566:369-611(-)
MEDELLFKDGKGFGAIFKSCDERVHRIRTDLFTLPQLIEFFPNTLRQYAHVKVPEPIVGEWAMRGSTVGWRIVALAIACL